MYTHRPEWSSPTEEDASEGPVWIWRLQLSGLGDAVMDTLHAVTVPSEHARAERYRFDADRRRHLAGRALVRLFVARRYGGAARDVVIEEDPSGKPHLDPPPGDEPDLEFNVAHADDVVVAAFSRTHPVGIDVEALTRDVDAEALSERVLTASERRHWRSVPADERPRFFLRLWTCKEAFLKATGDGLQRAPDSVECVVEENVVVGLADAACSSASAAEWALHSFPVTDRAAGAVVRKHTLPATPRFVDAAPLLRRTSHA